MAATVNFSREIQDSIRDVLDKKVKLFIKRMVKMEIRGDKTDNRILAFSSCRIFLLTAKVPSKLEGSYHFLDIQGIESKKPGQLTLTIDGKQLSFHSLEQGSDEVDHMITHVGISLKQIFPAFPVERLIVKVEVHPSERLKTMRDMIHNMEGQEVGACSGFTNMYQCMCDYHATPFREEIAWDVDTIYLSQDCKELRLQDFDHLSSKDLVPIVSAVEHNTWFRKLNFSNARLSPDVSSEIIKVMKRNAVVEEIDLSNTGIKLDFVQKLSTALISNSGSQLTVLDLSNNLLEDKGVTHLLGAIKLLPCGLVHLDLSRTGLSTRCLNKIGEVLAQAPNVLSVLERIRLADNGTKGEDFPMLYNCLAQPNNITEIDLSSTDCVLDALCDPLLRGCPNITTLKLSKTTFTHKKNKDVNVPQSWKNLFASLCFLELLDLSSCKLPVEAFKELLLGIAANRNLKNLKLDVSSNELGSAGVSVLASCFPTIQGIVSLDISNNAFDNDLKTLLPELSQNKTLKHLSLGRNFNNIKPKNMSEVMTALVFYIQDDDSVLESLSIADSRLRADTTYVINALGSNNSLQQIDISGNQIGDMGARMLAKALQINTKLQTVVWDRNAVTAQGFEDVASALERNTTLKKMPFPVNDATFSMKTFPDRTEAALQKIESYLQRNHSPRRFASDQAYRLQQGFLISSTQQMVDKLVVKVQDTLNALNSLGLTVECEADSETGQKLVVDANNSRQLFSSLQQVALKNEGADNKVEKQLKVMADQLKETIQKQVETTLSEMYSCVATQCPTVMSSQSFSSSLHADCEAKTELPKDFTNGVLDGASTDIHNWMGEVHLSAAAHISDTVIEEVIDSLTTSHKTLTNHLNLRRSGHYKDKADETGAVKTRKISTEHSPKLTTKRKSVLNRKTRPQSTIDDEMLAVSPAATTVSSPTTANNLVKLEEKSAENSPHGSIEVLADLDSLSPISHQPLQHVTKARPRREKLHRPTRPIVNTGSTEMEEPANNGPTVRSPVPTLQTVSIHKTPSPSANVVKPEEKKKLDIQSDEKTKEPHSEKKSLFGFMKLKKEDKGDKEPKPEKEPKKSSGLGLSMNIFKKDKKRHSGLDQTEQVVVETSENSRMTMSLPNAQSELMDPSHKNSKKDELAGSRKSATEEEVKKVSPKPTRSGVSIFPPSRPVLPKPVVKTETDTKVSSPEGQICSPGHDTEGEKNADKSIPEQEEAGKETPSPSVENKASKFGKLMPGFGGLGGRDLLQEMKLKQNKRVSQSPLSPVKDEKMQPELSNETTSEAINVKETPSPKPFSKTVETLPVTVDNSSKITLKDITSISTASSHLSPLKSPKSPTVEKELKVASKEISEGEFQGHQESKSVNEENRNDTIRESRSETDSGSSETTETSSVKNSESESKTDSSRDVNDNTDPVKVSPRNAPPKAGKPPSPAPRNPAVPRRPASLVQSDSSTSLTAPSLTPDIAGSSSVEIASDLSESSAKESETENSRPQSSAAEDSTPVPSNISSKESPSPIGSSSSGTLASTQTSTAPLVKPRPVPPTKPRPPVAPRIKKRDSQIEDNQTCPQPSTESKDSNNAPSVDEGIVYDSATLRMSVKDKIKKLVQSKTFDDPSVHQGSSAIKAAKLKALSLPKDAKLPNVPPSDSSENIEKTGVLTKAERAESITEETTEDHTTSNTQPSAVADDEIMV